MCVGVEVLTDPHTMETVFINRKTKDEYRFKYYRVEEETHVFKTGRMLPMPVLIGWTEDDQPIEETQNIFPEYKTIYSVKIPDDAPEWVKEFKRNWIRGQEQENRI